MTTEDLLPYCGTQCHIRLYCRACGVAHLLTGVLEDGRYLGEILIAGHTFGVEDVMQVWRPRHAGPSPRRRLAPLSRFSGLLRRRQPIAGASASRAAL